MIFSEAEFDPKRSGFRTPFSISGSSIGEGFQLYSGSRPILQDGVFVRFGGINSASDFLP